MKTSFNIAWVDDNFNDPTMTIASQLRRKIDRKNGFSLVTKDVYSEVTSGGFDELLSSLATTMDLSSSYDLILIDYELGSNATGEKFAKKFKTNLPSVDLLFYSGKQDAEKLRNIIASENVDGVNCVGRENLVDDTYTVIENIINRSHKISTLRGLILNSVCEMDHMIREILYKYSEASASQSGEIKNSAIQKIRPRGQVQRAAAESDSIRDLLCHKRMMSGSLFGILETIKNNLALTDHQQGLLSNYRSEILDLRTSAAHAKEETCNATGQSMLKFKDIEIKRGDIDDLCKTIVSHEKNIKSIYEGMN